MQDDDKPIELPIVKRNKRDNGISKPRDPRFDPKVSGSNDHRHFARNYSFLEQVHKDELKALEKALKKEKDLDKKQKIKSTISRIKNKMVQHSTDTPKEKLSKKELLVKKFHELKQTGKLERYIQRKRKKLIKRDSKNLV